VTGAPKRVVCTCGWVGSLLMKARCPQCQKVNRVQRHHIDVLTAIEAGRQRLVIRPPTMRDWLIKRGLIESPDQGQEPRHDGKRDFVLTDSGRVVLQNYRSNQETAI